MRAATTSQLQLGELDIASINISVRSRDDIPQLLRQGKRVEFIQY